MFYICIYMHDRKTEGEREWKEKRIHVNQMKW